MSDQQVGEKLRKAREAKGLSQEREARRLETDWGIDITKTTLGFYENGRVGEESMNPVVVAAMCNVTDADLSEVSPVIFEKAQRDRHVLDEALKKADRGHSTRSHRHSLFKSGNRCNGETEHFASLTNSTDRAA